MLRARLGAAAILATGLLAASRAPAAEITGRVILAKSAAGKPSKEVAAAPSRHHSGMLISSQPRSSFRYASSCSGDGLSMVFLLPVAAS